MSDTDSLMETVSQYEGQLFRVQQAAPNGDGFDRNDLLSGNLTEVGLDDLLPVDDAGLQLSDTSDDIDYKEKKTTCQNKELVHEALLTNSANPPLGSWEEHTRGIGSKLMAQMGYITGTGLGKKSDGRISPFEATIFPARMSLDYCIALMKNSGGDKDLFRVDRKMQKEMKAIERKVLKQKKKIENKLRMKKLRLEKKMKKQKKRLERQQRQKEQLIEKQREKNNTFNFINTALESKSIESEPSSSKLDIELKKESNEIFKSASYRTMFQDWRNNLPNLN